MPCSIESSTATRLHGINYRINTPKSCDRPLGATRKANARPTRYGMISRARRRSTPNSTNSPAPLYRFVLFPKYPGRIIRSNAK